MDSRKANGISPKDNERKKRPPSYSVETPYGFHLDLDFLKYVDDIEKGNTIRRVHVQRRQRGQNNGILSRNLSLPGYGCRAPLWNSFSTLWPKTQLADSHQHFDFHSDITSAGYARRGDPYKSLTTSDMDASIKAFDEQPLGCYVRPNLLRASSLPLTVLLRQHSEDPTSPKEYLSQENGSSDDVFHLSYSRMGGTNGTLQRLTAALERVGELETEIRFIPELKAQICILQEERERLLVQLHSQNETTEPLDVPLPSQTKNWDTALKTKGNTQQACDDWMNREYDQLEKNVKASSEQVDAVATPSITHKMLPRKGRDMLDKEDQAKSLDTLKKKVVRLEQELRRLDVELERTRALLKQQVEESRFKDEKIKQLTIHLKTKSTVTSGTLPETTITSTQNLKPVIESCDALTGGQEIHTEEAMLNQGQPSVSHADMEHHVKRLQELLQEQWECLCKDNLSGKTSSDHLPPHVCSIQDQLVTLVTLLSLYVFSSGELEPESKMKELVPGVEYENLKKESLKTIRSRESEKDFYLKKNTNREAGKGLTSQTTDPTVETGKIEDVNSNTNEDGIDGGTTILKDPYMQTSKVIDGDQAIREDSNLKSQTQREENREAVNKDFIDACCFLKDHMDKVSEPDNEMSKTLTVLFQQWFSVSAEEDAHADILSLYLSEVNSQSPTVLPFLVNMADDNGNTALHYSVSHCNFSIVKILLDTGMCKIDLRNKSGYTAITMGSMTSAESPGDLKVIQQLMELGDVNSRVGQVGQTALHLAVRHGRVPIVRLLLAQGADPNARDQSGSTPLISACERGHVNIVRILLEEAHCDVNLKDKGGRSALALATQASHTEIVDLLKARGETKSSDKCKVS